MIAFISDIHSNHESFLAVLKDLKKNNINKIYCLGDVVGYGPDPNKCINILRKKNIITVMGNHDYFCCFNESLEEFNLNALNSVLWTRNKLTRKNKIWLQNLPYTFEINVRNSLQKLICLTHSSIKYPSRWEYIKNKNDAKKHFLTQEYPIVLFGHTHQAAVYKYNPNEKKSIKENIIENKFFELDSKHKWLINTGSIGQPRDGISSASYFIYDSDNNKMMFKRCDYNYIKTCKKIISKGLPEKNAIRLSKGE